MSTEDPRVEVVLYWWSKSQECLEAARREMRAGAHVFAINRLYYAMFYAALALLQEISKVPSKHSGVVSLFDTEFVMKGVFPKELSKDFHKIFELRQNHDYRTHQPSSLSEAEETLEKASRFVQAVKSHLRSSR